MSLDKASLQKFPWAKCLYQGRLDWRLSITQAKQVPSMPWCFASERQSLWVYGHCLPAHSGWLRPVPEFSIFSTVVSWFSWFLWTYFGALNRLNLSTNVMKTGQICRVLLAVHAAGDELVPIQCPSAHPLRQGAVGHLKACAPHAPHDSSPVQICPVVIYSLYLVATTNIGKMCFSAAILDNQHLGGKNTWV